MRTRLHSVMLGTSLLILGGCQTTHTPIVDTLRVKQAQTSNANANASIYCAGVKHCEFERLNATPIIDATTHRVTSESLRQGIVRLQGSVFSENSSMYLSVPSDQYELVIRFYPISPDRAETFHVIQRFKPKLHYTFKMYRDRTKHTGKSLLNVSAPDPLCIDLDEEQQTIRRFCRPFDAVTGMGEFVEQKI